MSASLAATYPVDDVVHISISGELEPGVDLLGRGLDLEADTLIAAYRQGLFPMPARGKRGSPLWFSPDPRGILPLDSMRVSRSLRRSCRRFTVTVDRGFADVVDGCAHSRRDGDWITPDFAAAYGRLHQLGHAHSVEVWDSAGALVGGVYGVAVGGLFAGESMFSRATDASKVALVALVRLLSADRDPRRLFDVQWSTQHLLSLGAVDVSRAQYFERLSSALDVAQPDWITPVDWRP